MTDLDAIDEIVARHTAATELALDERLTGVLDRLDDLERSLRANNDTLEMIKRRHFHLDTNIEQIQEAIASL